MKIQTSTVTQIRITEIERLDPVTVILEDIGPRQGKIIISCYNKSWNAYWGGMGDCTIAEFFTSCDEHYLAKNLSSINSSIFDADGFEAFAKQHVIKLRKNRDIGAKEARELYDEIDQTDISTPAHHPDLMQRVFGDDWWYCLPEIENPEYSYLCRIINAVKDALKKLQPIPMAA